MRIKIKSLLFGGLSLLGGGLYAQQRTCAAMDVLQNQLQNDPKRASTMRMIEDQTQQFIQNGQTPNNARASVVVNIPVVFHVVYNNATENISDARLNEQLQVLNNDFRKLNSDVSLVPAAWQGITADCEINFCKATVDPNGAATTGITRTSTAVTAFSDNDAVKFSAQGGKDAWDRNKYLNIWVCDLSGTLLGYAQFPGGPASTDGVVLDYAYTGVTGASAPFNKGRTGTHEVGHWLNLYHIWGDDGGACTGSDAVSDTPNQADASGGCPAGTVTDACSPSAPGIMWMNYMDYTDDACMYMFTNGQKARVQALFTTGGARVSLLTSNGCGGSTPSYCSASGSTTYEHISRVQVGTVINNLSGNNGGYGNYTGTAYTFTKGTTQSLTLTPGFASTTYTEYWKVFIDYNNDLDFADAGENVYTSAGSTTAVTGSFTIPTTAVTGNVRMRVLMSDNATINACGAMTYGEVEDYTLNLTGGGASCGNPTGLAVSGITSSGATLAWTAVSGATSYNIQYKTTAATTWTTTTSTTASKAITGLAASTTYNWQVQAVCSGVNSSYVAGTNFTTSAATCTDSYEANESLAAAKVLTVNTTATARICTTTDKDWFRFTTTSTAPKVQISLTGLPADYDVVLYNSAGTQLGISQNGGTTSETINYNTATAAATYYVQVYGYNGANSSTAYSLRCSTRSTNFRMGGMDDNGDVVFEPLTDVMVFPNPTADKFTVQFESGEEGDVKFQLMDMMGKMHQERVVTVDRGLTQVGFEVSGLASGVYLIRVQRGDFLITKRIDIMD